MKRFKTARFFIFTTLLALTPLAFMQWRNYFPTPPQLASPRSSNGFVLHKIREVKYVPSIYGVVLSPPWFPTVTKDKNNSSSYYAPKDAFRVTAIASTGTRWNLGWHIEDNRQDPDLPDKQLLVTNIPKIYPASYDWLDVEIQNKRGGVAKWRLTNLVKGIHAVASATELNPDYAADGLFIHAQTQLFKASPNPWVPMQGTGGFYAVALPDAAHYWKVALVDYGLEWQARKREKDSSGGFAFNAPETPLASAAYAKAGGGGLLMSLPYPSDNRFAYMTLRVEKYASSGNDGGSLVSSRVIELTCPITVEDITHLKPKTPLRAARH